MHWFTRLTNALILIAAGAANAATAPRSPNIVLILADDMGWGDVSANNPDTPQPTPHIDRLGTEGIRFTQAHAPASVCAPTRYGLMTGRYAWRTWMREGVLYPWCRSLIPTGRLTLGSLLKRHGYTTAAFGKWHLGMDWTPKPGDPGDWTNGTPVRPLWKDGKEYAGGSIPIIRRIDFAQPIRVGPRQLGFDTYFGINDGPITPIYIEDDRPVQLRVTDNYVWSENYRREEVDDLLVARAVEFMGHATAARQPFFVYLPLTSMHTPLKWPKRFPYRKEADGSRGPMIAWLDDSVRQINESLERLGATRDTLVIFTSDNGPFYNGRVVRKGEEAEFTPWSSHHPAGPYRGWKTDIWEGGTHVPFLARWPAQIKPGSTSGQLICLVDVMATLAAIVGEELPDYAGEDSVNLLPALLGQDGGRRLRANLITHSSTGVFAIREGPWKLILDTLGSGGIRYTTPEWQPIITGSVEQIGVSGVGQLYNLADDPYETKNLYAAHPEIVQRLTVLLTDQKTAGRTRPLADGR